MESLLSTERLRKDRNKARMMRGRKEEGRKEYRQGLDKGREGELWRS